jgi:hypothetical protein
LPDFNFSIGALARTELGKVDENGSFIVVIAPEAR